VATSGELASAQTPAQFRTLLTTTASANQAAAANAAATATIAGVAAKFGWLTALIMSIGFAAAATTAAATVTGLAGGTWTIELQGGTTSGEVLALSFGNPIPTAAANTAIVASIPATGAAGPAISVQIVGFVI